MYQSTDALPVNVKSQYSEKALEAFVSAFNSVFEKTDDEARAFAAAHSAAKKVDGMTAEPKPNPFAKGKPGVNPFAKESVSEASFWMDAAFTEVDTEGQNPRAKVTIIKPGLSANNYLYTSRVLSQLVPLMEGAKAYLDHEKKSEIKDRGSRSVKDMIGWYENVLQDTDGSIKADLNFIPGKSDWIVEALKANPSLMGLSINARGQASRQKIDGRSVLVAEAFEKLYSTDLVTEAAAGGQVEMVASVTMDHDKESDTTKEKEMEEAEKREYESKLEAATWYAAEAQYKADVTTWLTLEGYHNGLQESTREWLKAERLVKVPEDFKGVAEDMDVPGIDKLMEALKNIPADKKDDAPGGGDKPEAKPGEEGYERKIL